MVTDGQVRKLRQLLSRGDSLASAARRTRMDEKTARKYRDGQGLPSERPAERTWRTRVDPFAQVWPEVQARLEAEPRLRAYTLFAWLQERYPQQFPDSQRRTFERRVRDWRGRNGPERSVMFPQVHHPGDLAASDFTNMNSLGITIGGQPFDHLLYHFTLTYSNWEFVSVCFSESFESLSRGFQEALWQLGGVPRRHLSDSLSAAVNNLSEDREFRARYRDLLDYYQIEPQRTNARQAHENGDVESSHGHLKTVIEQALLLRGSRDFASRQEYEQFLAQLIEKRQRARTDRFAQEEACLGDLPPSKVDYRQRIRGIKVYSRSTIQVKRNTYSVPSRLIGYKVDVVVDADFVEVWHAGAQVQRMPRLTGSGKHAINYRHVIDSLVRKPGAFENYQYHEDLFPTSYFRMAYDELCRVHTPKLAVREYLKILQLAARDSQDAVQDALRIAIAGDAPLTSEAVRLAVQQHQQAPPVTELDVELPDLKDFDSLLHYPDMEVNAHEYVSQTDKEFQAATVDGDQPHEGRTESGASLEVGGGVDGAVPRAALADVPRALCNPGGAGPAGVARTYGVSFGAHGSGVPSPAREPDCPPACAVPAAVLEDVAQLQLDATAACSVPTDGEPPRRSLLGPPRESTAVRQARFREESLSVRTGRTACAARAFDLVHRLQSTGAAVARCQAGLAPGQSDQEAGNFRRTDHRRLGLCPAESRGDGGAVYAACRAV